MFLNYIKKTGVQYIYWAFTGDKKEIKQFGIIKQIKYLAPSVYKPS